MAQQSSTMERRAQDAEREVDKLKKVEYMQQYLGEAFTGVISGVTSWGFFVELDNTIEGMVPINSLLDDFYVFDEESYKLTGEHTGRIFTLGQKVEIVVRSADKMERTIDFVLKEFSQHADYPDPDDYYGDGRAVDTYVKKVRKKLGKYAGYIQTVIKTGYIFKVVDDDEKTKDNNR